jgi:hypothetical protein
MSIEYVTPGPWGAGNGNTPLSANRIDTNFWETSERIRVIEENPPAPVEITNITQTGRQFTVHLSNGGTFGPFTLPVASFRARGAWMAATAYLANDLVSAAGLGLYLVLQDHTSDATFDADAGNSAGDYYQLVFPLLVPAIVKRIATATYSVVLADANHYLRFEHASGCTVTLPLGIFPDGTEIHIVQKTANPIVITTDGGVTFLDPPTGDDTSTNRRGAVATAKYIAALDIWDLFGDLAPVSA